MLYGRNVVRYVHLSYPNLVINGVQKDLLFFKLMKTSNTDANEDLPTIIFKKLNWVLQRQFEKIFFGYLNNPEGWEKFTNNQQFRKLFNKTEILIYPDDLDSLEHRSEIGQLLDVDTDIDMNEECSTSWEEYDEKLRKEAFSSKLRGFRYYMTHGKMYYSKKTN
uniref:Ycf54 n=1 Tax=Panagrolaimus sp. JU765 TaxID=591449 RepID=A0AC34RHN1_9BILA